jgi:hypothetical protein
MLTNDALRSADGPTKATTPTAPAAATATLAAAVEHGQTFSDPIART